MWYAPTFFKLLDPGWKDIEDESLIDAVAHVRLWLWLDLRSGWENKLERKGLTMADDTENQKHYIFLGFGNGVSVSARKASTDDEAKTLAREYAEGVSASEVFIYRIHDDRRDDPKELIAKIQLPG